MTAPHRSEPGWDSRRWTGTYAAYLKTEWWLTVARQWALTTQRYTCQDCRWIQGTSLRERAARWLEVHHLTYDRLGDECHGDLVVLCNQCHEVRHGFRPASPRPQPLAPAVSKYWDYVVKNLRPATVGVEGQ